MPRLSLCLIARDEEELLAGCLESVRGLVDELVVVDTGSVDGTADVARRGGARVVEHAWRDDFADARNASVRAASGDWILVLDADERLVPGAHAAIRDAIAAGGFDCGLLRCHHASAIDAHPDDVLGGRARLGGAFRVPRLLRRTADLAWRGEVHEDLAHWVLAGHEARAVDADVLHLGRVPEIVARKAKPERNRRLLEARCARETEDATPFGYLAFELLGDDRRRAREIAERGWALLPRHPRGRSLLRLAVARAILQLGDGDAAGARATADAGEAFDRGHPDLAYLRAQAFELIAAGAGSAHERRAALEQARRGFADALAARDAGDGSFVDGARGFASATRLGTVALLLGDAPAALAAFDRALAERADHAEARLGRAEALLACGRVADALAAAKPFLDDRPDGWVIAASAFVALGRADQARTLVLRATERADRGFVGRHRREALADLAGA
jgi:tetratricopeptide (TPR) repeat protein